MMMRALRSTRIPESIYNIMMLVSRNSTSYNTAVRNTKHIEIQGSFDVVNRLVNLTGHE